MSEPEFAIKKRTLSESPKEVANKLKATKAIQLRAEGKTLKEIADELDIKSIQKVSHLIRDTVRDVLKGNTEEYAQLQVERYESLIRAYWQKAMVGDIGAAETVRRVMGDINNMLGLNAPKRTEITGPDGRPIEIAMTVRRLDDALAAIATRLQEAQESQESQEIVVNELPEEDPPKLPYPGAT
jgi:orotate phosphoribosyltransferase-like protein